MCTGIFFHFPVMFLMVVNLFLFGVTVYKLRRHRSAGFTVRAPRR
jgi:hypothetical protein